MPAGRPSSYTPEIAETILLRIADGESLRSICSEAGMPAISTVSLWVVDDREGFSERYMRARKAQAHVLADELMEIADDGSNDLMTVKRGDEECEVENKEVMNRSRLRVDTRKWYLAKMLPKLYGEKLGITDGEGGPLQFVLTRAGKVRE